MGFASGSVSFRRFAVTGDAPKTPDEKLLNAIEANLLKARDIGAPEEVEYGWSGGRHVFDAQVSFAHNVFADAVNFALRIDTNRVPGDLKKAYQIMEEEALAKQNPSGFISKSQKKDVKEQIRQKVEEEAKSGKYRRSKLVPVFWDLPSGTVYSSASGGSQEKLMEIFERSFGCTLEPMSTGSIALTVLEAKGKRRDYEDLRPTRFVAGPEGEGQPPEYPWTSKGAMPKDFLGNEFLLWLWHEADLRDGQIKTESGEFTVFIDKSLDLDCAYGLTGRDGFRGDGPSRMPEAKDGLRSGKVPRKCGLVLDANGSQFAFGLNAETLGYNSAILPEVEKADTPRTLFEERVALLRDLCAATDAMFEAFLKIRCSAKWEGRTSDIRRWIAESAQEVVAAVA